MKEIINQVRKEMCYKCEACDTCIWMDDFCKKFAERVTELAMEE